MINQGDYLHNKKNLALLGKNFSVNFGLGHISYYAKRVKRFLPPLVFT